MQLIQFVPGFVMNTFLICHLVHEHPCTASRFTECVLPVLGAFATLRNGNISVIMSVCLYVHPSDRSHGTTRLPLEEFS